MLWHASKSVHTAAVLMLILPICPVCPAATTAGAKGAALTQRKVDLNTQLLSEKELVWNSEQEKTKGNEAFR
jgi:hypothetical protein